MREIKKIVIHCSDSGFGDVDQIRDWHRARGWRDIGYNFVITNGFLFPKSGYDKSFDGIVQVGRPLEQIPAHVKGHNEDSIGICLIGKVHFSFRQIEALIRKCHELMNEFNLDVEDVYGHYEFNPNKTCPNIGMNWVRWMLMWGSNEVKKNPL